MLRFFEIFIISTILSVYAEDVCVQKSPCSCEFSNGTGIDLTPAMQPVFYQVSSYGATMNGTLLKKLELFTYYFHPCKDILGNFTGTTNFCNKSLSICSNKRTMDSLTATTFNITEDGYYDNGYMANAAFSADGRSILYKNVPSDTEIRLICAPTVNQIQIDPSSEPNHIKLAFYSPESCLKQLHEYGRSFGSTLLIIFFSLVIFYLTLGVLTRKFLMGATGLEVIPNLSFWMDLPNLVKDGWAFARNGFKLPARGSGPTISPDPNSYDSI